MEQLIAECNRLIQAHGNIMIRTSVYNGRVNRIELGENRNQNAVIIDSDLKSEHRKQGGNFQVTEQEVRNIIDNLNNNRGNDFIRLMMEWI